MVKVKGYLVCLLFVPFALDTSQTNHCRVCQERWRSFLCHQNSIVLFSRSFHRTFYTTLCCSYIFRNKSYFIQNKKLLSKSIRVSKNFNLHPATILSCFCYFSNSCHICC